MEADTNKKQGLGFTRKYKQWIKDDPSSVYKFHRQTLFTKT